MESGIADFVLLSTVLHEVETPDRMLNEIARVLKPGGRLGIVEWQAADTGQGPGVSERIAPARMFRLLAEAGFDGAIHINLNEQFYTVSAVKRWKARLSGAMLWPSRLAWRLDLPVAIRSR
jgi:SAM-dependent methyltransferase